ncbi:MAG: CBS domain-containing protein [Acidobacteria bacterium]|nr:MAG: CBS domain-containing protein [Acidobacteriota bacterium]REJ99365.1 MAG: CBS domain-containing protein [Acidobacteriota bacterium]REK16465.1 MAG: CBS domain-containing protein [Acidobacteriota bacterium]REK44147.1 MAG: CBS domain-containing protein [Acidobacteriota bacterium]
MWRYDCGFVPVVEDEMVAGVITDRDIAIAAGGRHLPASQIRVSEVSTREAVTCLASDEVEKALKKMKKHRIRRLAVVDRDGALEGVVSIADVLFASRNKKKLRKKVLSTLRAVSEPQPIVLSEVG